MPAQSSQPNAAQVEFDKRYITSSEIMRTAGVNRTAVHNARVNGYLPEPISVQGQMFIWERATIQSYLDAWILVLSTRRGCAA